MRNLCIAVLAFDRPEFLYVTLDSIFRNKNIDKTDVNIYIDGGSTRIPENMEVISNFDVRNILIRKGNIRNFWSTVLALRDSFYNNDYEKCVFIEDDHIVRSDTIDWCLDNVPQHELVSLSGKGSFVISYRPRGCMILKDSFERFDRNWIMPMSWVGILRQGVPDSTQILTYSECAFDNVMFSYLYYNNLYMDYAQEYYTAHFGIKGVNAQYEDEETNNLYNKMFSGDRRTWVNNISAIIKEGNIPEKHITNLWLKGEFNYQ